MAVPRPQSISSFSSCLNQRRRAKGIDLRIGDAGAKQGYFQRITAGGSEESFRSCFTFCFRPNAAASAALPTKQHDAHKSASQETGLCHHYSIFSWP